MSREIEAICELVTEALCGKPSYQQGPGSMPLSDKAKVGAYWKGLLGFTAEIKVRMPQGG